MTNRLQYMLFSHNILILGPGGHSLNFVHRCVAQKTLIIPLFRELYPMGMKSFQNSKRGWLPKAWPFISLALQLINIEIHCVPVE